jgi:hypothetical protein
VNLHQRYTHGYGLCMSPVNRITPEGLPELWVRDIPPVTTVNLDIHRPEIYYGEQTTAFALVGTSTDEFDYPLGETNQSTRYTGKGGIGVGSSGRRLLFAWYLRSRDAADELSATHEPHPDAPHAARPRAAHRAVPALRRGSVSRRYDGRLAWIQMPTRRAIASEQQPGGRPQPHPQRGQDRHGCLRRHDDVLCRCTARADAARLRRGLPGAFPFDGHAAGRIAGAFALSGGSVRDPPSPTPRTMQDPQVFYNREDLWSQPIETTGGQESAVEPYYTILRLPGGERPELVPLLPFTPARKDNMVA